MRKFKSAWKFVQALLSAAVFCKERRLMNQIDNLPNLQNLSLRMTTDEVCQLARFGKSKLRRHIKTGKFPKPIDRGGEGYIWNTTAVLDALGINLQKETMINPWEQGLQ